MKTHYVIIKVIENDSMIKRFKNGTYNKQTSISPHSVQVTVGGKTFEFSYHGSSGGGWGGWGGGNDNDEEEEEDAAYHVTIGASGEKAFVGAVHQLLLDNS